MEAQSAHALPELPPRILRLHYLRWDELKEISGFAAGDHLKWQDSPEKRTAALARVPTRPSFTTCPAPAADIHARNGPPAISREERAENDRIPKKRLADWQATNRAQRDASLARIGVAETVELANARFKCIIEDYFSLWAESSSRSDQFAGYLGAITELVLREVGSLWQQRGDWFERVCRQAIENGLAPLIAEWTRRARGLEMERLQNLHDNVGESIPPMTATGMKKRIGNQRKRRVRTSTPSDRLHLDRVAKVEYSYGNEGQPPFVAFYRPLIPPPSHSEFAAWMRGDRRHCGSQKWAAIDKAADNLK